MSKNWIAKATTSIQSTKSKVWEALVTPYAIKQYMFGVDVESDWREGSDLTWKGETKGKKYKYQGVILKIEPEQTLQYTYSPCGRLSGKPDKPENYQTVTIDLAGSANETKVSLSQDNNSNEKACKASENNWEAVLEGLKNYVEKSS